jgi:hypothetical protein
MNSLVTYNTRRAKLFKKILQTDLTEDEWIEFTTHITAVENKIVDAINKGHVDNECINFLKNNFWFIDGFIRHKLKYCKMFMIQNDIECSDISESDIEIDSKDLGNPLFQGCKEEKFNKDSIQKVFGSKVVNSLDQEVFDEISLDCQSLDDLKTIVVPHVPGYIAKDIDFNAKINEATGLDNVSIEVKSSNPFTTNEKNDITSSNHNPLIDHNTFLRGNKMFSNKDEETKIKNQQIEKKLEKSLIEQIQKEKNNRGNILNKIYDNDENKIYNNLLDCQKNPEKSGIQNQSQSPPPYHEAILTHAEIRRRGDIPFIPGEPNPYDFINYGDPGVKK